MGNQPAVLVDLEIAGSGQRADIHLPPHIDATTRVMINVHGGGWYTGDKSLATLCCVELARRGLIVVNVDYGIPPSDPVPTMVADVVAAIAWTRTGENVPASVRVAAAHGVCLAGDSAGAHLALLASAALREEELAALLSITSVAPSAAAVSSVVSWSGALSLAPLEVAESHPESARFAGYRETIGGGSPEHVRELDPSRWMAASAPPLLAFTSARDFFHDATAAYVAAAPHPAVLVDYNRAHVTCTHSWQLDPRLAESRAVYEATVQFVTSVGPATATRQRHA